VGLTGLGGLVVANTSCATYVHIRNDSALGVSLFSCDGDVKTINSGQTRDLTPIGPCTVFGTRGDYLGCLRIPPGAFGGDEVIHVSETDRSTSSKQCPYSEDYKRYTRVGKFWAKVGNVLMPPY
jgi:hypothetical protein